VPTDFRVKTPVSRQKTEPIQCSTPARPAQICPQTANSGLSDLPPPNTQRWVARRKAEVVTAVRAGLLSLEDACRRYSLSTEEFLGWEAAIDKHGLGGLRVTRIQDFR
jgi:hypothetical protein